MSLELALLVGACVIGTIAFWIKVLRPVIRAIVLLKEVEPALKEVPGVLERLDEIVGEFHTNAGSSMRDAIDKLVDAADDSRITAKEVRIGAESARQLALDDRTQLSRLLGELRQLATTVTAGAEGVDRLEVGAGIIADDLADSHRRADEVEDGTPGEAADAHARSAT